ncbi:MAG TPA: RsmE family RNA methyltransferase [Candidatus Paceibacterota bacterium]|nr:RsmE family RNA methyltransferase [Candidatus Paceibacterota bacterium]
MHRFYLPPENCAGNSLRLDGREAHHALKVLRVKYGELVAVLDGAGNEFLCTVENCSRDSVTLSVSLKNFKPPPSSQITLLVAIPKGKIIESIIQKSVELCAHRIVPVLSERVVAQLDGESAEHKRGKWQTVAIEAIKQCGAAWLPEIEAPLTIGQFLARKEKFDLSLVGSLQKERRHPREVFQEFEKTHGRPPKTVGVWIGPEGDFTLDELKMIQDSGAFPISLGRLVLRVETAAIYCLSVLNYELQRD